MIEEEEKRDTLPAPPPTEPENPLPVSPTTHAWCAPELGPCASCDEFPMLRAQYARERDEAGRA